MNGSGTNHKEDFASAAGRHLDDANHLLIGRRFDNAAYLSGYVVECSLKSVIESTGMTAPAFGHSLSVLSGDALELAFILTPSVWRYEVPETADVRRLHAEWAPSRRYWRTGETDEATARSFLRAATVTYATTTGKAILDGRRETRS